MNTMAFSALLAISLVTLINSSALSNGSFPNGAADESLSSSPLLAQYLDDSVDDKRNDPTKTLADLRKEEGSRIRPRLILGIGGGLSAREGFANIAAFAPLGMLYGKYAVTAEPSYMYMNAKSFRTDSADVRGYISRTGAQGQIHAFSLPLKFTYSFLDLEGFPYTPYITAGAGYAFRKFSMNGSSILMRAGKEIFIHCFTLDYGFGFMVKITGDTRLNVGLQGVSFFNKKDGVFNYDTTGASITFSMMALLL